MNIEVFVTLNDIKSGKRSHCDICPVALAINRALATAEETDYIATVGGNNIILLRKESRAKSKKKHIRVIPTPLTAKTAVFNYDKGRSMRPFSFELSI